MSTKDDEELGYVRLAIILPKDALAKLDALKDNAGLASRGRTVQELVDTVWEIRDDMEGMLELTKQNPNMDSAKQWQLINPFFIDIARRVFRFKARK